MATPKNNVVQYEFQGNVLPLEKAFAQVGKLFRRYIKEAQEAARKADPLNTEGKLGPDEEASIKTMKHLYKRLKVYSDKSKQGIKLTGKDKQESSKIYKELLRETTKFLDMRNKLRRKAVKEEKKQEESKREVKDWTATSTQFKASVQAEQLAILTRSLPRLPDNVKNDIDSYVQAWKKASEELAKAKAGMDGSEESAQRLNTATEQLATATKNLDTKSREYSATLKTVIHNEKSASNEMERMLGRVISMVTSFEWWFRVIREGITLLGDYVESLNFIQVATNNIKDSAVECANASSRALDNLTNSLEQARWSLGLNATDANTAAATYVSFANAMNMTGDAVSTFGQNMTQLSIDMASLYNKDTIVMMTALRSGLAGNTRALMNYGISVHDATLNEWMLARGLNKTMTELSETSQMMVRYMYIMEKTTAAQGDLNRTLRSPANQLRVLKTQLKLLMQNLGAIFNLFIYPAIRLLNMILMPLNAFISALTSLTDSNYSTSIGDTSEAFDDLTDSIDNATSAAKGLSGLDEINQMTSGKTTTKIGIDADIQELFDAIKVYENFQGKTNELTNAFRKLGESLAPIWALLSNTGVLDAVAWCLDKIGYLLWPINAVLEGFRSWFGTWPEWLQNIVNFLGQIVSTFAGMCTVIIAAAAALTVFKTVAKSEAFLTFVETLRNMVLGFKALLLEIVKVIKKFVLWIADLIKGRIEAYKNACANYILEGSYWKLSIAKVAAAGVAALAVAGAVTAAVLIAKHTAEQNQSNGISYGQQFVAAATGGVVTGPTFALVGEGKYDEAIVPLGNSPQMAELQKGIAEQVVRTTNITGNNGIQSGGGNATVQLNIDGRSLGRASINNINRVRRQVGVDIK